MNPLSNSPDNTPGVTTRPMALGSPLPSADGTARPFGHPVTFGPQTGQPAKLAVPVQTALCIDTAAVEEMVFSPLRLLPAEVRRPAVVVWLAHKHLFGLDTPLPIAAAIAIWIARHGLRPDDAADILAGATSPAAMGEFTSTAKLVAWLAAAVDLRIKQRAKQAETADRRAGDERDKLLAADQTEVREMCNALFPS